MLKKSIFLFVLCVLVLNAQEEELNLDPNDIPLTPDSTLEIPAENTLTTPNVETPVSPDPVVNPALPPAQVVAPETKPVDTLESPAEVLKPTPSNLEVNSLNKTTDTTQKEERFNETYSKYHKESTSEQNWEKVVGKRTADTYIVNKGDTLWDISGTLFGDPFYWPKVWSLNKELIFNPHVIFPDMKIKFFQGNSKTGPTLATDNQKDNQKTAEPVADSADSASEPNQAVKGKKEDAPNNAKIATSRRKLPRSFRDQELQIKKEVEIQIEEYKAPATDTLIRLEFYVSESPLESSGQIVEVESELKSAGDDQYVFVKFDGEPKGIYTVVKPAKELKEDRESTIVAEIHEVEGEVKVLGKVNSEENIFRAQILKTNTLVTEGSMLIPGRIKTFTLQGYRKETTATMGRIIGNLNNYDIVSQGSFVIINQGSQGGYQTSMLLPIYEDLAKRNSKSLVKENPQKVGSVVIVESTPNFSIGYVDRIFNRILIKDFVGMAEGGEFNPKSASNQIDSDKISEEIPVSSEETPIEDF